MSAEDFFDMNVEIQKRDDYKVESWDESAKKAVAEGFEIVMPRPSEILLDLDSEADVAAFNARFKQINEVLNGTLVGPAKIVRQWKSKSGEGLHVVIDMQCHIEPVERIAWQAIFGSDFMRETIAVLRKRGGVFNPSRLFKPAETKGDV